jgi:pantetheine-phosphate adenylyltransferase
MNKSTVVYPGFFDPFTLGHQDVVMRATEVFEKVVVAVAKDSPKVSLFTFPERFEMTIEIFKNIKNVKVDSFDGLLINYMRINSEKVLLRGLRTVSDFEYEFQMAQANKTLDATVETFFMMTDSRYSYLSSTLIREIARLGGDISLMVPEIVAERMKSKKI